MELINDFNLKKQAEDLGVKVWQTPSFLFIVFGFITAIIMMATYFISKNYDNPQVIVISESLVVIIVLTVGTSVIRFVDQVVRLNKAKSEFISIASHQLRTPLSAIKWETELLSAKLKKKCGKKQLKNLENISSLNQRMIRLVNDLLDVARIDQDGLILRKRKFNLSEVVSETYQELLPSAKLRNIKVILNIKKQLPTAIGDPDKIKLAVENILSNAIKYTPSGGKIEIKLFRKKSYLVLEIKDNGVGIPEEQLKKVFNKFFRSDNAARYQTDGTGLGLYIAKNIIEQLDGKIWFESIENVGSVFSFSLPLAK